MMDHRHAHHALALSLLLASVGGRSAFADWAGLSPYGAVVEISIEGARSTSTSVLGKRSLTNTAGRQGWRLFRSRTAAA